MADFYHVTLTPRDGVSREEVEAVLNHAIDWYRYQTNCWVIYTTSNHSEWLSRLEPLVKPGGTLLLCKIEYDTADGWLGTAFWDWWRNRLHRRDAGSG